MTSRDARIYDGFAAERSLRQLLRRLSRAMRCSEHKNSQRPDQGLMFAAFRLL